MAPDNTQIIITDTSVLINFLNVDKIMLLRKLPYIFSITEHVISEVTQRYQTQQKRLQHAIKHQLLKVVSVDQPEELKLFATLVAEDRLGIGECSAIACAINRNYALAIDDAQARKQALKLAPALQVLTTEGILQELIANKIITAENADTIKDELQHKYRFTMKINSFEESTL